MSGALIPGRMCGRVSSTVHRPDGGTLGYGTTNTLSCYVGQALVVCPQLVRHTGLPMVPARSTPESRMMLR